MSKDLTPSERMRLHADKGQITEVCKSLKQIMDNMKDNNARKGFLLQYCRDNSSTHAEYLFLKKQMFSIFTFHVDKEEEGAI